jgi:chromosome segregation and condensation protein ScpB
MRSLFHHVKLFSDRLEPMVSVERTQNLSENSAKVLSLILFNIVLLSPQV